MPKKKRKLVLLIDDSLQVTQFLQCIIENYGYDVIAETNPLRALETFRERYGEIDLIVIDYKMPGMDGLEFSAEAMNIRPFVPIVLISGFPFKLKYIFSIGLKGYIQKPFNYQTFLTLCRRAMYNFRPGNITAFSFRSGWEYRTLTDAYISEGLEMGEKIIFAANKDADYPCCMRDGSIYENIFFNPELFLVLDAADMRNPENFFRLIMSEKKALFVKEPGKQRIRFLMDMDWMKDDPKGAIAFAKAIHSKTPKRHLNMMCHFNENLIGYDLFRELMDYHTGCLLGTELID